MGISGGDRFKIILHVITFTLLFRLIITDSRRGFDMEMTEVESWKMVKSYRGKRIFF